MTILSNAHTHTTYCDGKNSAEEMVEAAIAKGFQCLGFSCHGYTPFDESYCLTPGATGRYIREIRALQEKYRGTIDIVLGTEWDYYGQIDREDYDYIIGSVHYIQSPLTGKFYTVDSTPEELDECLEVGFHGNVMAMLTTYYNAVADMAVNGRPDILGHFDLIRKLNSDGRFFDEESPAYLHIAVTALEKAVKSGVVIEVNTGGVYRGYRSTPYPADTLLRTILRLDGRVIVSSDAHDTESLGFQFDETEERLRRIGFTEVQVMTKDGLRAQKL